MIRLVIIITVVMSILGIGSGAVYYYKSTQAKIEQLTENNARLDAALQTKDAAIEQIIANAEKQAALNQQLQSKLQEAESYQDTLRKKLSANRLLQDSLAKPKLIEEKINNGTQRLFDSLESDTAQ